MDGEARKYPPLPIFPSQLFTLKERDFVMKKQFVSALAAACLTLSLTVPASAGSAVPVPASQAAQVVSALGIMTGDAGGGMNLSSQVTRAEFVTMAVKAAPDGDQIGQAAASPYPDVPRSHWASGYVEAAVGRGLVSGYSDGTFRPNHNITLALSLIHI